VQRQFLSHSYFFQSSINVQAQNKDWAFFINPNILPFSSRDNCEPMQLPPGTMFVLGDNRDASRDSRIWGVLDIHSLKGRVLGIYWSFDREASDVRWQRLGKRIGHPES
jgi:signal peptidase I